KSSLVTSKASQESVPALLSTSLRPATFPVFQEVCFLGIDWVVIHHSCTHSLCLTGPKICSGCSKCLLSLRRRTMQQRLPRSFRALMMTAYWT
ncbi:unnamed protein product, partial [Mycena citricolor]